MYLHILTEPRRRSSFRTSTDPAFGRPFEKIALGFWVSKGLTQADFEF